MVGDNTISSSFTETKSILEEYSNTIEKILAKGTERTRDGFIFKYFWVVEFEDNKRISQYDTKGNEVLYRKVLLKCKTTPITKAWLIPFDKTRNAHGVAIHSNQKLIIVRRRVEPWVTLRAGKEKLLRSIKQIIYLIGYEETIKGKVIKTVLHINELGDTILNNDFNFNYVIKREVDVKDTKNIKSLKDLKAITKDGNIYSHYIAS